MSYGSKDTCYKILIEEIEILNYEEWERIDKLPH